MSQTLNSQNTQNLSLRQLFRFLFSIAMLYILFCFTVYILYTTYMYDTAISEPLDTTQEMHAQTHPKYQLAKRPKTETNHANTTQYKSSRRYAIHLDEQTLYETVERYHNSFYKQKIGDKCTPRLPKCIILGVGKCGTRELSDFMAIHPNIVIKRHPYEPAYFLRPDKSLTWYKDQMPCSYPDQITSVKSPEYFTIAMIPEKNYNYNKTLKMILMVREPISRVLSGASFKFLQVTKTKVNDLSKMPPLDDKLVHRNNASVNELNLEIQRSVYDIPMLRYLQYFGRDQILVISTEDFKQSPWKILNRVESFLGLKHYITEDMFVFNAEKQYYCLKMVSSDAGRNGRDVVCYGPDRGRTKQKPLKNSTINVLRQYFATHNEAFFDIIGERFDWSYDP